MSKEKVPVNIPDFKEMRRIINEDNGENRLSKLNQQVPDLPKLVDGSLENQEENPYCGNHPKKPETTDDWKNFLDYYSDVLDERVKYKSAAEEMEKALEEILIQINLSEIEEEFSFEIDKSKSALDKFNKLKEK